MYSVKDYQLINKYYFNIIELHPYCIVIQSKNTKHYWKIQSYVNSSRLYHKHKLEYEWHEQKFGSGIKHNVAGAIQSITAHDTYWMMYRHKNRADN